MSGRAYSACPPGFVKIYYSFYRVVDRKVAIPWVLNGDFELGAEVVEIGRLTRRLNTVSELGAIHVGHVCKDSRDAEMPN